MPGRVLRSLVHAEGRVIWDALVDSLEHPAQSGANDVTVVKTAEGRYLREYNLPGLRCRENITIDDNAREIHGEFADDCGFAGKVTIKVVPTSVQNPVAPSDLQYFVDLDDSGPVEMIVGTLHEEQLRLKDASEEVEQNARSSSQGNGRFHHPA